MLNRLLIAAGVIVIVVVGVLVWHNSSNHNQNNSNNCTLQAVNGAPPPGKYTKLSINIKNGQLVGAADNYIVNPGTGLEFQINTDECGKVYLTSPAKTITFTKRPLVFYLSAPQKAGTYPIAFQANSSVKVIKIGAIVVRSVGN